MNLKTSLILIAICLSSTPVIGVTIEGFTQPAETVKLAAPEAGIIQSLRLRQGEAVSAGQEVAVLDNGVLHASLAAARAKADSKGPVMAAEAAFRQRKSRRDQMLSLRDKGHASPEELDRAETDFLIAEANLVTAREEAITNRLAVKQIEAQVERRTIRSPIAGVISEVAKRPGEFVTATDAAVATVVQINKLRVIFHVPTGHVSMFRQGESVDVQFAVDRRVAKASIDFVSPITDAQSNLVRVEVIIDNAEGNYRSGVRCYLVTDAATTYSASRPANLRPPINSSRSR